MRCPVQPAHTLDPTPTNPTTLPRPQASEERKRALAAQYGEILSCTVSRTEFVEAGAGEMRGNTEFVMEVKTERGEPLTVRRRFPDFVELDAVLQPHAQHRAAGPGGGAGSSAGFDPGALVLPAQVTTFYKNDTQVVEDRRQGLQRYLDTAIDIQTPDIATILRLFFFSSPQ